MKAITLWQPWASLIANGTKTIETRSWAPPRSLLGQRIAIHASARFDRTVREACVQHLGHLTENYPLSVVVATAVLSGFGLVSARIGRSGEEVYVNRYHHEGSGFVDVPVDPYGDFSPGRWLWFLEDVLRVDPPAPAKGRQGFWNWEAPPAEAESLSVAAWRKKRREAGLSEFDEEEA